MKKVLSLTHRFTIFFPNSTVAFASRANHWERLDDKRPSRDKITFLQIVIY